MVDVPPLGKDPALPEGRQRRSRSGSGDRPHPEGRQGNLAYRHCKLECGLIHVPSPCPRRPGGRQLLIRSTNEPPRASSGASLPPQYPPRAGRRGPFRAPDTDPSLGRALGQFALQGSRGPQNGGLGRSCALTELGVCVAVMRTGGLRFLRLVPHRTTPYLRLLNIGSLQLRLCCAIAKLTSPDVSNCG